MKYISPTGASLWNTNKDEFYLKYVAIDRPPRIAQTQAMAVGSAFDAFIKCYLSQRLFGKDKGLQFDDLFSKQVEPQNHDFAMKAGGICFQAYKQSTAMSKLFEALNTAKEPPMFEFTATNNVDEVSGGIFNEVKTIDPRLSNVKPILLGKPDVFFITKSDFRVILDWKVNGYCSASGKNPTPGYLYFFDGFTPVGKNHGATHKDAVPCVESCGFEYSLNPNIELLEADWGRQLCTYSWLCGAEVGSQIVVAVDQLCCKPSHPTPNVSVALHRCVVTEKFQVATYQNYQEIWEVAHSDHFFRDMSKEDSQKRCQMLSEQVIAYQGDDPNTEWLKGLRTKR